MNKKESSQTAYQSDASLSAADAGNSDHGWAKAINRMIDQRYAFLALAYEDNAYLFRGMSCGLFAALLESKFWHYAGEDRANHFEQELDVLFLTQDFSDAYTIAKLWEQKSDACIIVFRSELFNRALIKKKAAMMATAEPGVVFKYPFLTEPLAFEDIDYLVVPEIIKKVINDDEESSAVCNLVDINFTKLRLCLTELCASGKLIFTDSDDDKNTRSAVENELLIRLQEKEIIAAKTMTSPSKPSSKN